MRSTVQASEVDDCGGGVNKLSREVTGTGRQRPEEEEGRLGKREKERGKEKGGEKSVSFTSPPHLCSCAPCGSQSLTSVGESGTEKEGGDQEIMPKIYK